MICSRCGTKNAKTSKYCRECGKRLVVEALELEVEEQAEQSVPPTDEAVAELLYETLRLCERGDLEAAFAKCRQALRMNPNSPSARSLLGLIYERKAEQQAEKGNREDAEDYLNAAIRQIERVFESNPESVADRDKLAELRGKLERLREVEPRQPDVLPARVLAAARRIPLPWAAGVLVFVVALVMASALLGGRERPAKAQPVRPRPSQPSAQPPMPPPVNTPSANSAIPAWTYQPPLPGSAQPPQAPSGPREELSYDRPDVGAAPAPLEPFPIRKPKPASSSPTRQPEQVAGPTPATPEHSPADDARDAYARGDYDAAASAYQDAISRGDDTPENRQALGMCLYNLGKKDDAASNFNRAIQLYLDRKAKGIDVDAADQGIRTCKQYVELLKG